MSSDILDVLNISGKPSAPLKKKQKTNGNTASTDNKLTGINRELYQLLGSNTPPVPIRNQQKFKDRLNSLAKPSSWSRVSFKNGARTDGLRLKHWIKGKEVGGVELAYKFEKYNTSLNIPEFTEEDYELFIAEDDKDSEMIDVEEKTDEAVAEEDKVVEDETKQETKLEVNKEEDEEEEEETKKEDKKEEEKKDKEEEKIPEVKPDPWDYKETRYLFDLSKNFDLKWVVINDRYNYPNRRRTIEELQERFYTICQRILIHENEDEETTTNSNLISNLNFNKNKESERKKYLNRLLNRSPAEIAEEESLLIEARKFEAAAKKTITERSALLQLLDSPQSTGSISQYLTSQGLTQLYNSLMTEKRKRKLDSPAPENPLTALNEKIKQQQIAKQKQQQLEKQEQLKKKRENPIFTLLSKHLTPREEEAFGLRVHTEKISPGVFLRSSKVSNFKPGVQNKINEVLNQLGLGKKPVLATERVVNKQEELIKTINTMLELKRQYDKLEAENKILK